MPITVAIADSQYLIRVGLLHLLKGRDGLEVVGEASTKEGLFTLVGQRKPDVLIYDYNKPDAFGKEELLEVRRLHPAIGIMVISADDERESIYQVLEKGGVNSFLTKECDGEEILQAIQAAAKGEKYFCSKVLDVLLQKTFQNDEPESCEAVPLTIREIEIVKLVAEGKTAKEISEDIHISTHTIYTHRKNIMKKLSLGSTSELVLFAVRNGIVEE